MIKLKQILEEKANNYYPKHIMGLDNNYNKTVEFQKLNNICSDTIKKYDDEWSEFEKELVSRSLLSHHSKI